MNRGNAKERSRNFQKVWLAYRWKRRSAGGKSQQLRSSLISHFLYHLPEPFNHSMAWAVPRSVFDVRLPVFQVDCWQSTQQEFQLRSVELSHVLQRKYAVKAFSELQLSAPLDSTGQQ